MGCSSHPTTAEEERTAKLAGEAAGHLLATEQVSQRRFRQCPADTQHLWDVLGARKFQGPLILDSEAGRTASQLRRTQ